MSDGIDSKKITVEFQNEYGRRFAIDRIVPFREVDAYRGTKIRIAIGFESITMPRHLLGEILRQLSIAEAGGMEYPEDAEGLAKAGYGVARP